MSEQTEEQTSGWQDFPGRRNPSIITLTEGDVLIMEEGFYHVADGEITIYADKTIDQAHGELIEIAEIGVQNAVLQHKTVFDMKDLG